MLTCDVRCCIGTIQEIKREGARIHFHIRERESVLHEREVACVTALRFTGEIPPAGSLVEADPEDVAAGSELSVTHLEVLERRPSQGER